MRHADDFSKLACEILRFFAKVEAVARRQEERPIRKPTHPTAIVLWRVLGRRHGKDDFDINETGGRDKAERLKQDGHAVANVRTDVSDAASVDDAVAACIETFGSLDIMVANAGIGQRPCPIAELQEGEFRRQFDINVMGVVHCCQRAVAQFRKQGSGNTFVLISFNLLSFELKGNSLPSLEFKNGMIFYA